MNECEQCEAPEYRDGWCRSCWENINGDLTADIQREEQE